MSLSDAKMTVAQKLVAAAAYITPSSVFVADAMQFLNSNTGAVAAVSVILTFFVNWYYQRKRSKDMLEETRRLLSGRRDD